MLHLGSTGCRGDATKGEITSCANPNRIPVKLASFDSARQRVVLDLKPLFAGIDLGKDQGFSTGCMSGPADPECAPMFENLGLRLKETAPDATTPAAPARRRRFSARRWRNEARNSHPPLRRHSDRRRRARRPHPERGVLALDFARLHAAATGSSR
jgi:hypothetical protein